jgi:hypothetical protein
MNDLLTSKLEGLREGIATSRAEHRGTAEEFEAFDLLIGVVDEAITFVKANQPARTLPSQAAVEAVLVTESCSNHIGMCDQCCRKKATAIRNLYAPPTT